MFNNGFTNWDDDNYVLNNALLRGPEWAGIFTKPVVSNYHPLTIISLAFNYAVSGTDAWSYLFLNLLFHVINTILVFVFIYRISEEKTMAAFFTALIFGIHPMHVESVAWISERKDVLYTFFFLLSLLQYCKYLQTGKQKQLWICFLFFALSLLSKPAAIVLPMVLFLLDYWMQRTFTKKLVIEKIPFFLAAVLFTVITLNIQSVTAITSLNVYPLWMRFFFACYGVMTYFFHFFIPYPLSAFYPFPPPDNLGWQVYASPLFVLVLLFLLWRYRKNKLLVFGFMFYAVNLILVLQFVSVGYAIVSDRYTYVPYIGIAFLFSMLVNNYLKSPAKTAVTIACVAVISIFAFLTFQRVQVWKNSDSLWTNVIEQNPLTPLPRGKRAEFNFNKAISPNPGDTSALLQQVIEDCSVAIDNNTGIAKQLNDKQQRNLYYMRGSAYNYFNQNENAFKDFSTCLIFDSGDYKTLYNRAVILVNYYKNYTAALADFTKAIQLNPRGQYYLNRSICYYNLGDLSNAKTDAQTAIQKGITIPKDYLQLLNL